MSGAVERLAGSICHRSEANEAPRKVLVLDEPDGDGQVRVLPLSASRPVGASWRITAKEISEGASAVDLHARLDRPLTLATAALVRTSARVKASAMAEVYRSLVKLDVERYARLAHGTREFVGGETAVPASGKVVGAPELLNLVDASLDGWLTTGRFNEAFEARLARVLGVEFASTVNSGSSANLVAFSALTAPRLGERAIRPGDEVITVAAAFPTTVNPALQFGAVPVFVDVHIPTYNVDPERLEEAISPRTRAIMLAHTLGNPFNLNAVAAVARKHGLWLVEDCCDALGARYGGQPVGSFGDIGTLSFYPAHQITTGEGGAVFTRDPGLKVLIDSFRDWGRDCYCAPGKENTCGKRFAWKLGELPEGYDHKYTYSHLGYNLKMTDMQAACGLAQLDRLEGFVAARRRNFDYLRRRLESCSEFMILPQATPNSEPSWFGFAITLRESCGFSRPDLLNYLDQNRIGTRLMFAGNLARQPYMLGRKFRISGTLANTDTVMNRTFWIGVYPALTEEMLDYVATKLEQFVGVGI